MFRSRLEAVILMLSLSLPIGAPAPFAAAQPPEEPTLALAFDATSVTVAGAPSGGRVALVGVARERDAFRSQLVRYDEVIETDEKGAARFELPEGRGVSARSVWAAVELAGGGFTIAAPLEGKVERVDAPAAGLGAARRFLDAEGKLFDVLLVRPESGPEGAAAAGVWGIRAGDGGGVDRDGEADARISLAFADLMALAAAEPAPEELRPRDVLVGVDTLTLAIWAVQLADGPEGE